MICKRIMTEFAYFSADETAEDLKDLIMKNCKVFPDGPCGDFDLESGKTHSRRREQHQTCRDLITALAICNNVTPVP
jgi:hypothetical protein